MLTELIVDLGLGGGRPTAQLYPLPWTRALEILNPAKTREIDAATSGSHFVHLWTSVLKMSNVLTAVRPPASSFLDTVYRRYAVPFETELEYGWPDVASVVLLQSEHEALGRQVAGGRRASLERLEAKVVRLEAENETLRVGSGSLRRLVRR